MVDLPLIVVGLEVPLRHCLPTYYWALIAASQTSLIGTSNINTTYRDFGNVNINITYWDFGNVNINITYWDFRSFQKTLLGGNDAHT